MPEVTRKVSKAKSGCALIRFDVRFCQLQSAALSIGQSWSAALIRHAALLGAAVGLVHVALALYSRKDVREKGWADNIS